MTKENVVKVSTMNKKGNLRYGESDELDAKASKNKTITYII